MGIRDFPLDESLFSVSATARCGGCGVQADMEFRCAERHAMRLDLPRGWVHGLGDYIWKPACSPECQEKIEKEGLDTPMHRKREREKVRSRCGHCSQGYGRHTIACVQRAR